MSIKIEHNGLTLNVPEEEGAYHEDSLLVRVCRPSESRAVRGVQKIIVGDQHGRLARVTLPPTLGRSQESKVTRLGGRVRATRMSD